MNYEMAPLSKEMLPELLSLEQACFSRPWTKAMFEGELENIAAIYRVILRKGQPVAYMGMWVVADEGQITNVAVHPDHRRKGLAVQLIDFFINFSREKQLAFLTLEVRAQNQAAIYLYEKMGFQVVGRRKGYYEGKEDALLMTLFLKEQPTEHEGEK